MPRARLQFVSVVLPDYTHYFCNRPTASILASMLGSRFFCQRGFSFNISILVDEERKGPNTAKKGLSSARQRNAINGVLLVGR